MHQKLYKHIKTGGIYELVNTNIINATNKVDGERMVLYYNFKNQKFFVREYKEFFDGRFKEFPTERKQHHD